VKTQAFGQIDGSAVMKLQDFDYRQAIENTLWESLLYICADIANLLETRLR